MRFDDAMSIVMVIICCMFTCRLFSRTTQEEEYSWVHHHDDVVNKLVWSRNIHKVVLCDSVGFDGVRDQLTFILSLGSAAVLLLASTVEHRTYPYNITNTFTPVTSDARIPRCKKPQYCQTYMYTIWMRQSGDQRGCAQMRRLCNYYTISNMGRLVAIGLRLQCVTYIFLSWWVCSVR